MASQARIDERIRSIAAATAYLTAKCARSSLAPVTRERPANPVARSWTVGVNSTISEPPVFLGRWPGRM